MKQSQLIVVGLILLVGAVLGLSIWQLEPARSLDPHGHEEHDEPAHATGHAEHEGLGAQAGHDGHEQHDGHEDHAAAAHDLQDHGDQEPEAGHVVPLSAQKIQMAGIVVKVATADEIAQVLQLPGEISLNQDRTSHIVPRVPGVVESVPVELGQQVEKGQVLASIASAELSNLRSELMAAEKRLALVRDLFTREQRLWDQKLTAERDYLQARQALREAEIDQQNARQKLQALGMEDASDADLNRYEVRAPFAGTLIAKHITLGEAITADANIFTLADLSNVWAMTAVPARDLPRVALGTPARIEAVAFSASAPGRVSYIGAVISEQTRTAPARVVVPNPDRLWRPGLFVRVLLRTGLHEAAVTVDSKAIQTLEDRPVVFVREAEGFRPQPVRLGVSDGERTEVLEGLEVGAEYAAAGSFVIKSELGKASVEHSH